MNEPAALKAALRDAAQAHGFDAVAIASPDAVPPAGARLAEFVAEGCHGDMQWLAATADRRGDPRALWPEVRAVIMLGVNYGPQEDPLAANPRFSERDASEQEDWGAAQARRAGPPAARN